MKLSDGVYNVTKWIALILIPGLSVAYQGLAKVWGWGFASEIATTANILCALLGTIIGISTYNYNNEK